MFDSVRMTFKVVFFPCLRTGIAAPLRDTVFLPVVFLLVFVFLLSKRLRPSLIYSWVPVFRRAYRV